MYNLKGVVDSFFHGLIVFMGCSVKCLHASFKKNKQQQKTDFSYILALLNGRHLHCHLNGWLTSSFYDTTPS